MPPVATPLRLALVFVVACGGSSAPPTASATAASPVVAATSAAASATPTSAASPAATTAPFLRTALTDVRSGERFTLGGFTGKTVIVQGMAVW